MDEDVIMVCMENTFNHTELEKWYQANHRALPFRESQNPYFIWVIEIMAQQTQMETVVPYFERFIRRYPTVQDLANTDSDTLHKMVEGIGYYRRFQHMHEAAKIIVSTYNGIFPTTHETVLSLPGVGEYTAGAIMSIAYNKPYAATDGNVIRVLSRFFRIFDDMRTPKARRIIAELNQKLIIEATPHIYTQAIMELGALVCRPQNPLCESCPLRSSCAAYKDQLTAVLPVISPHKKPKIIHYTTLIIEHQNKIALLKKEEGLLKGMYLFPQFEDRSIEAISKILEASGFQINEITKLKNYRHVFTHTIWSMSVYKIGINEIPDGSPYTFFDEITSLPMAIAHRKIKF